MTTADGARDEFPAGPASYPHAQADRAGALIPVSYDSPAARELTRALHAEQVGLYGRADAPEAARPADFTPPRGAFLVVTGPDGTALACGGWRTAAQATAEIKRMYVTPAARGHGLGRQILAALEGDARRRGMTQVILETGVANAAALALYTSRGYTPIASYVAHRDPHINRALRKSLAADPVGKGRPFRE
ncbi:MULTISPECIES: GNAT family N-acetyltransferase [Streptomyces]|uniref:GNAT family N-acetyltransferase n=1 Tax=Streptomyces TaxID=1883 RepID=UPI001F5CFEEC|nr:MULTISPECIES: GNAT family N-acetyltransferase [Streptomyces]